MTKADEPTRIYLTPFRLIEIADLAQDAWKTLVIGNIDRQVFQLSCRHGRIVCSDWTRYTCSICPPFLFRPLCFDKNASDCMVAAIPKPEWLQGCELGSDQLKRVFSATKKLLVSFIEPNGLPKPHAVGFLMDGAVSFCKRSIS